MVAVYSINSDLASARVRSGTTRVGTIIPHIPGTNFAMYRAGTVVARNHEFGNAACNATKQWLHKGTGFRVLTETARNSALSTCVIFSNIPFTFNTVHRTVEGVAMSGIVFGGTKSAAVARLHKSARPGFRTGTTGQAAWTPFVPHANHAIDWAQERVAVLIFKTDATSNTAELGCRDGAGASSGTKATGQGARAPSGPLCFNAVNRAAEIIAGPLCSFYRVGV